MREFLDEAVGPEGMFIDHPNYWMNVMDDVGLEGLWVLRGKGVDLTRHEGLLRTPEWLCYATTPLGVVDARGDCAWLPLLSGATVLVHHLRPQDPAAHWLLELTGYRRGGVGRAGPILTILWDTPLAGGALDGHLPPVRHYADNNMVYFHSNWSANAIYSSFQARWQFGHSHDDIGHFSLWAHRHIWAIDSGYGLGMAEAHNTVLIDGKGMGGDEHGPPHGAGGELRQVLDSPLATLAEADQRDAYSYLTAGVRSDGITHQPGRPVAWANRFWHVIHGTGGAPTYLVVVDRIQKDLDEHDYTWLLGTPMDNELRLSEARATLHNPHNAEFLRGLDDPALSPADARKSYLEVDFTLGREGDYDVWVFLRSERNRSCYIEGWIDERAIDYTTAGGLVWKWHKLSPRNRAQIAPGKHTLRLYQTTSPTALWIRRALLTRKAGFEPRGTEIVNDEDTLTVVLDRQNTRLQEPWAWTPLPYPRATLEVAFLQPDQVQLSEDVYRARGPWHQEEHRRLRATSRALRGDFVTVLYPRREDLPALTLNQSDVAGFERCLQWPSAVDFLDQDGRLAGTAHGGDGEWALVRETKAVDGVCYLLTDGTRLEFRGRPLVETRGLGPYGQVSVTCDGQTLAVHAHLQQNARWQVERQGVLRAYGPQVQNAVVNGVPAPFTREGDHVWVPIRTRRFVSTAERITQRIQQKYDQGEALGER